MIGYRDGNGKSIPLDEKLITGGSLGGLMRFRQEALDKTQNQIGHLAVSLTTAFNEVHKQGIDLDGEQGKNFFSIRAPQAYSGKDNSAEVSTITFDTTNVDKLRATDYQVRYNGSDFSVTRQDSGEEVSAEWDGTTLSFGGINMTLSGTLATGDTFSAQPVRRAAADMDVLVNDLDKIAAALGPVRPMPYSTVDFQSQSATRLGETEAIGSVIGNGGTKTLDSGLQPIAFIPVGAKNVKISISDFGLDDDIQLFTQDGKHLIGTPVDGANPDKTWIFNGITSAEELASKVFKPSNGFVEGTSYNSDDLLNRTDSYDADLANLDFS